MLIYIHLYGVTASQSMSAEELKVKDESISTQHFL